jgi:broad specificity phosphatase PhoE
VRRGLERLLASPARSALLVLHKGVIRVIVQELHGEPIDRARPALGEVVSLTRDPKGFWFFGRRPSSVRGSSEAA